MKIRLATMAFSIATVLALAACGSNSTEPTPSAATSSTGSTIAAAIPTGSTAATTSTGSTAAPACYQSGADSCNCSDFTTQKAAQAFHDSYDSKDVNKLDSDGNGRVCESLP